MVLLLIFYLLFFGATTDIYIYLYLKDKKLKIEQKNIQGFVVWKDSIDTKTISSIFPAKYNGIDAIMIAYKNGRMEDRFGNYLTKEESAWLAQAIDNG